MKMKIVLFGLLCCLLVGKAAKASETEPNNTWNTANTLALNGSNTGIINPAGETDWWKVATSGDGALTISLTALGGHYTYFDLYDTLGVIVLHNGTYTNGSANYTVDGLAKGTYYIKVYCYYATDTSNYKISNTLTVPAQANDVEPNNVKAQASALPQNGSKTGHVGYYFKNYRDTADWYKLTTNSDGLLRLSLTPANGQYVYVTLYDNDGTTVLNTSYSNSAFTQATDGLAAGTYYLRVYCYYNYGFAPYTLSDSLFKPTQANDIEPNNTAAQASVMPLNNTVTGHAGYFYNNHRDTADWYKLTTNEDGSLRLSLTPANGQYVYVTLYDNNGTTVLNSSYSNSAFTQATDGLAAGTYYLRVYCYYNYGFTPYTLSDSLSTYNANDAEPNKYFKQAVLLNSNSTSPGHVGFYYNGVRDTVDNWKINYTGSGTLQLKLTTLPHASDGSYNYTYLQVYKDTTQAPIYNQYFIGATPLIANLTALAKGYYYIKVFEYYSSQFSAYTLSNSYTEIAPKVTIGAADTAVDCSGTNSITYKFATIAGPYSVQLFRFGTAYGTVKTTSAKSLVFSSLPDGSYYAVASVAGASINGKSKVIGVMPMPTGTSTTNITTTSAKTNWTVLSCAKYYSVQYRDSSSAIWITKKTTGNVGVLSLTGLTANHAYFWKVAAVDSANKILATSATTDSLKFRTLAAGGFADAEREDRMSDIANQTAGSASVYPNPASSVLHIQLSDVNAKSNSAVSLSLRDMNGRAVWSTQSAGAATVSADVSQLSNGIYILQIINADKTVTTQKIVISK